MVSIIDALIFLLVNFNPQSLSTMTQITVSRDVLFEVCATGDLNALRELLQNEAYAAKAIEQGEFVEFDNSSSGGPPITNLLPMLMRAAKAGSADMVEYLISFANSHDVAYETIVNRPSVIAAIGSTNNVDIFEKFVAVKPNVVNEDLEYTGVCNLHD